MPAAPLGARTDAATDIGVFDGRMFIWGGRDGTGRLLDDGAWFDPATRAWTMLPASGLAARDRFGFDADGDGITIWGGVDATGQPLSDGARLVVRGKRSSWQVLPAAPLTPGPAAMSGDMNATFVVTPAPRIGDPPRFAVLDEDDGSLVWDDPAMPDVHRHGMFGAPPVPPGVAYEVASARDALLLLSYQPDGTAVVSWFRDFWAGEWTEPVTIDLPAWPGCPAIDLPTMAWIRGAGGTATSLATSAWGGVGWQALPSPPVDAITAGQLVWAPGHLIAADTLLAYDVGTGRWTSLPGLPDGPRTGVSAAWQAGRLYVWGGRTTDDRVLDTGWVFTPSLPKGTYRLPGGYRSGYGDCGGLGFDGPPIVRIGRHGTPRVTVQLGPERVPARWPDGYTVRLRPGRPAIIGPDGAVIAHDGDDAEHLGLGTCWTGTGFAFT